MGDVMWKRLGRFVGMYPNKLSCVSILSSFASVEALINGEEIHGYIVKCGWTAMSFWFVD